MKRVTFETALRLDELGIPAPYSEYCEIRDAYALNIFSFLESSGNKEVTVGRGDFIKDYLKSTFDSSLIASLLKLLLHNSFASVCLLISMNLYWGISFCFSFLNFYMKQNNVKCGHYFFL